MSHNPPLFACLLLSPSAFVLCSNPANYDRWPQVPLILSVYAAVAGAITTPILAITVLWRGSRYALPPPKLAQGQQGGYGGSSGGGLNQPTAAPAGDGAVLPVGAVSSALVPVGVASIPTSEAVAPQTVVPVITAK